ncbi:MAG: 4Fe-4S binding protein [Desulfobacterales bacterium]|nr:4Fe-4S binding protein [Desulfobacterales bacterium]
METGENAYVALQRHLDRQAIGFPATRSGAELRILKHIFTPAEARVAACLTYAPEPIDAVFKRAAHLVATKAELAEILAGIEKKGGIEVRIAGGEPLFCNAPLVVGMYEFQLNRLTPEFIADFNAYTADKSFGIEFLSTKLPQMRTIPISQSIRPQHHAATFDEVTALLAQAEPPFAVFECICRKKKALSGGSCRVTGRPETCLASGSMARAALRNGIGREIDVDASLSILAANQKEGLVLQPSNTQKAEFICSCCGCCCGMLGMHRYLPRPVDFWAANYYAVVAEAACSGCGRCAQRCQVGAASVPAHTRKASVALSRCIGCGLCVPTCPEGAIALEKKPEEVEPPRTRDALLDIIMSHKRGRFGKLSVAGKLLVDAIRTGQTRLLR